jgi:hypothetical protein
LELKFLECEFSELTVLDVSLNTKLTVLGLSGDYLTSLDVSSNVDLEDLDLTGNLFTTLDVSSNDKLRRLNVDDMPSLGEVCVWDSFVPIDCYDQSYEGDDTDTVCVNTSNSPNICFQADCDGDCSTVGTDGFCDTRISVYPNPTHTQITIETGYPDHYFVEVTSVNGQLILEEQMQGPTHQLDLSIFEKGVYFITIKSKDFVTTRKIVKL